MKSIISMVPAFMLVLLVGIACDKKNPTNNEEDPNTATDVDGNVYQSVVIGNQRWTTENLKVTHYRDGSAIPNVTSDTEWAGLTSGAYCAHGNDEDNAAVYGYLYNWYALTDARGLAPEGWRVATEADWKELEVYLGMSQAEVDAVDYRGTDEGGALKQAGTGLWSDPNVGATNASGFTALPGGYRYETGGFHPLQPLGFALFWTGTAASADRAWDRVLSADEARIYRHNRGKECGMSVRLIKED